MELGWREWGSKGISVWKEWKTIEKYQDSKQPLSFTLVFFFSHIISATWLHVTALHRHCFPAFSAAPNMAAVDSNSQHLPALYPSFEFVTSSEFIITATVLNHPLFLCSSSFILVTVYASLTSRSLFTLFLDYCFDYFYLASDVPVRKVFCLLLPCLLPCVLDFA